MHVMDDPSLRLGVEAHIASHSAWYHKKTILTALRQWCYERERAWDPAVEQLTRDELFSRFLVHAPRVRQQPVSWWLDTERLRASFPPLEGEALERLRQRKHHDILLADSQRQHAHAEQRLYSGQLKRLYAAWTHANRRSPTSLAAYAATYPERVRVRGRHVQVETVSGVWEEYPSTMLNRANSAPTDFCAVEHTDAYRAWHREAVRHIGQRATTHIAQNLHDEYRNR